MTTRRPVTDDVLEAVDAAEHNYRAGNHELAQTHALMAILHLLTDEQPVPTLQVRPSFSIPVADVERAIARLANADTITPLLPTEQGVYEDRTGVPWWRTAVASDKPWMDLTHGHSDDRWFTNEYAAQYAPFTRMEAVA